MHELAPCRVLTKFGSVEGHVEDFTGDLVVVHVDELPEGRGIGDEARLTVFDPVRGVCVYVGLIGGLKPETVLLVVLERSEPDQRRSAARAYYRVECVGKVETAEGTVPLPVTVVDVSASGVRFVTRRLLQRGDVARFPLPTGSGWVDLTARVLRIEEGQHEWRYGCELLDLTEPAREQLFRLVLRLQREAARQRADARP